MTETSSNQQIESTNWLAFETIVSGLAARFVGIEPDKVDGEIEDAQRRVCECLGLDVCALWQWEANDPSTLVMTHLYRPLGGPPIPERFEASESFPWSLQQVMARKIITLSSTEEAPAEAAVDLEGWRHYGIKTTLTIPLAVGNDPPFGAVSFNDMRAERIWAELLVKRLKLVARIFSMAIARKYSDETLRDRHKRLQRQLEFERLISELSTKLTSVSSSDIDVGINSALHKVSGFFNADRVTLFRLNSSTGYLDTTYVYTQAGIDSVAQVVPNEEFPWVWKQFQRGNPVVLSSLMDLPEAAGKDRESFQRYGVRSHISVPVSVEGAVRFVLAVASLENELPDLEVVKPRLELVARILTGAISRKELEFARDENARFERMLADISARLNHTDSADIDQEIDRVLQRILDFFCFDIVSFQEFSDDKSCLHVLFSAIVDGVQVVPYTSDRRRLYPWAYDKLLADETLVMNASDLPEDAQRDREYCRSVGLRSFASIPLHDEKGVRYVLNCLDMHGYRQRWEKFVPRLKLLGNTIVNCLHRKKAWLELKEHAEFDQLLGGLSTQLLDISPKLLDDKIRDALLKFLGFLNVKLCMIAETIDSGSDLDIIHSVAVEGYEPLPKMQLSELSWFYKEFMAGKTVVLESMDQLPPEAKAERRYVKAHGVTAMVNIPLIASGTIVGGIAFYQVGELWKWDQKFLERMRQLADVLANAMSRKHTFDALAISELRYRTVANFTYDWEYWEGPDGQYLYVSPSCEQISGHKPEVFLADPAAFRNLILQEDLSVWDQHKHAGIAEGDFDNPQIRIRTKSGDIRWIEHVCRPVIGPNGEYLGTRASNRDITQRKQAELALKESESWLSRTQHIAHVGSWDWDIDRNQLKWSDEVHRIFGLQSGQIKPTYDIFLDRIHPEDREIVDEVIRRALDEHMGQYSVQYRIVRPGGSERIIKQGGEIVHPQGDGPTRMIGSIQDITEHTLIEAESYRLRIELAHLDRVTTVGIMAGALAHEINQPLAAILSNAQVGLRILDREYVEHDDIRDLFRDIVHDDKRAGEVIRRLRTMLKKQSSKIEHFDLSVTAEEVATLLRSELIIKEVDLAMDLAPDPLVVHADPVQVQQIIINLLLNALHAIQNEPLTKRRIVLLTRADVVGYAQLIVSDSGHGIPQDQLEAVFEPFFSTKSKGMGLGLAICKHIAKAHGGDIVAGNLQDGGAQFILSLPTLSPQTVPVFTVDPGK